MKKIIFLVLISFIFLFGQTYSKSNNEEKLYLIKLSNITSKNIDLLDDCMMKIVTIYPENIYNIMDSYVYSYETNNQNINNFENMYLKKINRISSTKYYEMKLRGIKINYIKGYTNFDKIKKCNNYLEKVESL